MPRAGVLIIRNSAWGGYQDEDNLIAMNNVPVKTFDDMRHAAKGWKSGENVELTILRKGEKITMPVTLGGQSKEIKEKDVIVTITKRKNITDSQRAILAGILGQ